jgi:hypothetical protein
MDGHPTVTVVAAWVESADPILSVTRTTDILFARSRSWANRWRF